MPLRPARRTPDLERVARILGSGSARRSATPPAVEKGEDDDLGGWLPSPPRAPTEHAPDDVEDGSAGGGGSSSGGGVASAVRRLTLRATDDDEVARLDADLRRARRPALLTVPDELRTARRGLSSAAVVALLALVVAVCCAFVLRVLWAERSAPAPDLAPGVTRSVQVGGGTAVAATVPAPNGRSAPSPVSSVSSPSGPVTSGAAPPATGAELVVHVVGQVARPGLVRLRPGARVADAISAAGGTRAGADVAALNLARLVVDGEQIRVPKPGEPTAAARGVGAPGGSGSSGPGSAGATGPAVSLNSADVAALDGLPGVGPVLAQRIVDWRTEHGRFTSVDELGEVSGIGDKLMAQLRPRVTL